MKKLNISFFALNIYPLLTKNSHLKLIGGAEIQQLLIGQELARRGFDVSYITTDHGQKEVEHIGSFQVTSTYRPNAGIPLIRSVYPKFYKIWKALKKVEADIYYVRCAGPFLAYVVLFAKLNKKKVIFSGASSTDFDPTNVRIECLGDRILFAWGLRRVDAIIAQTKQQQEMLFNNYHKRAYIIPNAFPKDNYDRYLKKDILWVSNVRKLKNPIHFIELARKIPNENFVMIGANAEKTDDLYNYIIDQATKVQNLNFKGFLPFPEVEKYFLRAKLLINTSDLEGFPNTFLQAWSKGVPVISYVDPDDLIKTYHLGLVVKTKDEMLERLKDVLENKITFSSNKIISYFESNLTIEKAVDMYENLFFELTM